MSFADFAIQRSNNVLMTFLESMFVENGDQAQPTRPNDGPMASRSAFMHGGWNKLILFPCRANLYGNDQKIYYLLIVRTPESNKQETIEEASPSHQTLVGA